jgi:hypothetical protein
MFLKGLREFQKGLVSSMEDIGLKVYIDIFTANLKKKS